MYQEMTEEEKTEFREKISNQANMGDIKLCEKDKVRAHFVYLPLIIVLFIVTVLGVIFLSKISYYLLIPLIIPAWFLLVCSRIYVVRIRANNEELDNIIKKYSNDKLNYKAYKRMIEFGGLFFPQQQKSMDNTNINNGNNTSNSNEFDPFEKEKYVVNIKRVAKTYMIFKLIHYIPALFITLLLVLPLINVNFYLVEGNISIFDIFLANSESDAQIGLFTIPLAAEYFGIPLDEYSNFFASFIYSSSFANKSIIDCILPFLGHLLPFVSIGIFIIYVLRAILDIVPSILKSNVEDTLRMASYETLIKYHVLTIYEKNSKQKTFTLLKRNPSYITLFIFFLVPYYTILSLIFFLYNLELVTVSPILTILLFPSIILMIIGDFGEELMKLRYHGTLYACKILKKVIN